MMRFAVVFVIYVITFAAMWSGEPFCTIRSYDERDGLSQCLVKQVVQDDNGMLWVATWNGLNRFDGYEFKCLRPGIDDEVRRYSSRISDIKLGRGGMLWCRIDGKVMRFDVNTYSFFDSQSRLEEKFGCQLPVSNMMITAQRELVAALGDGTYIIMCDSVNPESGASRVKSLAGMVFKPADNDRLGNVKGYDAESLIVSCRDDAGTVWLVTRDGEIMCAPSDQGPFKKMGYLNASGLGLRYALTDTQGNVWLCSKSGLHRLTFGTAPYTFMRHDPASMLRTSYRDSDGKLWLSWSDAGCLTVSEADMSAPRYVTPDGPLSHNAVPFGAAVYSIFETRPGEIWLGTKPDGLYRLRMRPDKSGYNVDHFSHDASNSSSPSGTAYYSGAVDSRGRLWLASLGTGIDIVPDPSAPEPEFRNLSTFSDYPVEALSVRCITIINDSMAVAATTGGLLSFEIPRSLDTDTLCMTLHVSEPGRETSLGNVATMDARVGVDGALYVATESDGVARLLSPLSDGIAESWDFSGYRPLGSVNPDVALSLCPVDADSMLLVTSSNEVYMLDPSTGATCLFGSPFWHRDMRFSDASPLQLADSRWLLGLYDGAVCVRLDNRPEQSVALPLTFTSVSIAGRPDSLLSPESRRVVLLPPVRDVTLGFSALCYAAPESLRYAFKVDDDDWTSVGASRSVSFANLKPGEYVVTVRSTDIYGRWLDNDRSITIEVVPVFWETGFAKALYIILLFAFIGAVIWIVLYIRRIKRYQREMLEAHLRQLEERAEHVEVTAQSAETQPVAPSVALPRSLSDEDKQLMDAVMDYIENHLSDSSVTVDDMALAVAVSRSGLTRKMKSLMGVTPAEFLRETRLNRASTLLTTTGKPIKEIAADCGFSDMNYFGKCFKSSRGITPGAYRKAHGG